MPSNSKSSRVKYACLCGAEFNNNSVNQHIAYFTREEYKGKRNPTKLLDPESMHANLGKEEMTNVRKCCNCGFSTFLKNGLARHIEYHTNLFQFITYHMVTVPMPERGITSRIPGDCLGHEEISLEDWQNLPPLLDPAGNPYKAYVPRW